MSSIADERPEHYWFARHSKSIIFLIFMLAVVGDLRGLTPPGRGVSRPRTFPRIIIGVDNGVMPIEQMEVTITRPIEEAVNSVPGLEDVRSVTSRGSAEVDLFFNWNVDMMQTLQLVDSAMSRIQSSLPSTAQDRDPPPGFCELPDPRLQPDVRQSSANGALGTGHLRHQAAAEPPDRRRERAGPGRAAAGIPGHARSGANAARARVGVQDILDAVNHTNMIDSPGLLSRNHQLFLGLITAQVQNPEEIGDIVDQERRTTCRCAFRISARSRLRRRPVYTVVTANGKPAVLLSVNRQPDSNTVQVADEVHQEMAGSAPSAAGRRRACGRFTISRTS